MTTKFYFVRHGESEVNATKLPYFAGICFWANLTEKGRAQSRALGEYFLSTHQHFDEYYSSYAIRAQQTTRYCFEAMGILSQVEKSIKIDNRLVERSYGDLEGLPKDDEICQATKPWDFVL